VKTSLGAILLNPPNGSGDATRRHLAAATRILGHDAFEIANLFPLATLSSGEVNELGSDWQTWVPAQAALRKTVGSSDEILLAWGIGEFNGATRQNFRRQKAWLLEELRCANVERIWLVDNETRHPSRWHQFVSDRHGRTIGGTFEQRIGQVLRPMSVLEFSISITQ